MRRLGLLLLPIAALDLIYRVSIRPRVRLAAANFGLHLAGVDWWSHL